MINITRKVAIFLGAVSTDKKIKIYPPLGMDEELEDIGVEQYTAINCSLDEAKKAAKILKEKGYDIDWRTPGS